MFIGEPISFHEHFSPYTHALLVISTMGVCSTLNVAACLLYTVCKHSPRLTPIYPQEGKTALHVASCAGQTAVVRVLLDHGADVHAVTKVGRRGVLLDGRVRVVHLLLYMLDT